MPSYVIPDGREVWMRRKRQAVRFYDAAGVQVGPEQTNVAPAVCYAITENWRRPDSWYRPKGRTATRRLGRVQLAILRTVNQARNPIDATSYEVRCRLSATAQVLLRRGLLGLYAHNHPTVTGGGCQWYLTDAGRNALAVRS
jgi:hypothetical protein